METTYANTRIQSQQGWVAVPGTAGISQRVTADVYEERMSAVNLRVLVPTAEMVCTTNEY